MLQAAYDEEMRRRKEEKEFKAKMKREQFAKDMKIDDDESEDEEEEEEEEESDEKEKVNVAHVDRKLKSQRNKEWRKRMEVLAQKERLEAKGIDERLNKIDDFQTEVRFYFNWTLSMKLSLNLFRLAEASRARACQAEPNSCREGKAKGTRAQAPWPRKVLHTFSVRL